MNRDFLIEDFIKDTRVLIKNKDFSSDNITRLTYLMSEVGELSKEVLDYQNNTDEEVKKRLINEGTDVIWNVLALLDNVEDDTEKLLSTMQEKLANNHSRTWGDKGGK